MEYKTKDVVYNAIGPGTAGVAQRISSREVEETSGLLVLMHNEVMPCSRNQY